MRWLLEANAKALVMKLAVLLKTGGRGGSDEEAKMVVFGVAEISADRGRWLDVSSIRSCRSGPSWAWLVIDRWWPGAVSDALRMG